jgi:5-methylcytosine-specific restriction protein A
LTVQASAVNDQAVARSRKQAWLRDELILALDLYLREGQNAPAAARQEVSDLLRAIPIEVELAADPRFRSRQAVAYKLGNFVAVDPNNPTQGFAHGGQSDADVWAEYATDPVRLASVAAAIRANLSALKPAESTSDDDGAEAEEGALLSRLHRVRERNRKLVAEKKARVLKVKGALTCEACGFDFGLAYGEHGGGYIECHHTIPLHSLRPGSKTKLDDLALVCANCHRMIHRRAPWLTMDAIRLIV